MDYNLCLNNKKLMFISAKDEFVAWEILKKAGVKNKSKLLKLVELNGKKIS